MLHYLEKSITDSFHQMYYNSPHTWNLGWTKWMGVECFQLPSDLWVMQEIIFETKPDILIETGSARGGSALFFATLFDQLKNGIILSIDKQDEMQPQREHIRVCFFKGLSTDPKVIQKVEEFILPDSRVLVFLDSDHSTENVLAELRTYHKFVTQGCYLLIHDTMLDGPKEAVNLFLSENNQFERDEGREKFYHTFLPGGWLRKKEEKDG